MNQHYFDVPFAFSGDKTAIPDPLQSGGTVSFTEGWNYNYQRNLATDPAALPIDRSTMNWLLNQITTALQALQQNAIPEFITSAQNGGVAFGYGPQARVMWSASGNAPFTAYVNITGATNTNTPSASDPLGSVTGWQVVCDPIATSAQASAGTNNAAIMTPLLVAQQTALRALLAGNSSQVFNVGPATAATHAVQLQQVGHGQCYFSYVSSSQCVLKPQNGNNIIINGVPQQIPSAGVTLAPSGLVGTTFYYVYAYMSGGTMTLEASTTARVQLPSGIWSKTGDATRTLIGAVWCQIGGQFGPSNSVGQNNVLSFFNRRRLTSQLVVTSGPAFSNTAIAPVFTASAISFVCWSDDAVFVSSSGTGQLSAAGASMSNQLSIDGTLVGGITSFNVSVVNGLGTVANTYAANFSEGALHIVNPAGAVSSGVGSITSICNTAVVMG